MSFFDSYLVIVAAVVPVFLVVGVGVLVRSVGLLDEVADVSLLRVLVKVLMPCLILTSLANNEAARDPVNLIAGPLIGFGTVAFGYHVAWWLAGLAGLKDSGSVRAFVISVGIYNYGFIPIPLVKLLFPEGGTLGVLLVHNQGVEIAIWSLAIIILRGGASSFKAALPQIITAPFVAVVIGASLNLLGVWPYVPEPVMTVLSWLGGCAVPMALLLTGATVCDFIGEFRPRDGVRATVVGVALRMLLLPALMIVLAALLPVSVELKQVMIVQAAMPCAMIPIILSRMEGADTHLSLRLMIVTSIIALISIPMVIHLGLLICGLDVDVSAGNFEHMLEAK